MTTNDTPTTIHRKTISDAAAAYVSIGHAALDRAAASTTAPSDGYATAVDAALTVYLAAVANAAVRAE